MGNPPFRYEEIPLAGCPVADGLTIGIEPSSKFPEASGDFVVVLVPSPCPTELQKETSSEKKTDEAPKEKQLAILHPAIRDDIKQELDALVKRLEFTGAEEKSVTVRLPAGSRFSDAGLLGIGRPGNDQSSLLDGYGSKKVSDVRAVNAFKAAKLGKPLAAMATSVKAKSMTVLVDPVHLNPEGLQSLLQSFIISQSKDLRFKSKTDDPPHRVTSLNILLGGDQTTDGISKEYTNVVPRAFHSAHGIQLTRELVNAPPNICHPESLAKAAVKIATELGMEHKIFGLDECIERKMGAFLAVNQGSVYEPRFIHLTYKAEGPIKKRLVLIGKGVCMDTGGYNLKIGGSIEVMKFDMAGAAAVFGAARTIGGLRPPHLEVHFIVAAAENMISSAAFRPGDILTASNGKTIEIGNTDAEGRLTLADALIYAEKECRPDMIIDCATLTGAIITGLGNHIAGVYATDDALMQLVLESGKTSGTTLWPMPLFSDYKKNNESPIADLSNLPSDRAGGSISAALFLSEFVKDTPWCHIDLAGPVWDGSAKSATGYGATLLAHAALHLSSQAEQDCSE